MKFTKFNEITIIGPGLIGSSLGLSLKKKKILKIVGIDFLKNLNYALQNKSIDEGRLKIDQRIHGSDVIFICTPVKSIIDETNTNQFFHIYLTVL